MQARDDENIVRQAVKLIGNPDCREDVEFALDAVAVMNTTMSASRRTATKRAKRAAGSLAAALRRVEMAADSKDLDMTVMCFPRKIISKWKRHSEKLAKTPSQKPAPNSDAKKRAAEYALGLLRKYDKHVATTKGSRFCRLAALLYADPKADLHHQCRAVVKAQNRV
jgi:hypothetical protein